jgi:aryl-alcohol dehydrogenase-like predicted oxidoreductase
MLMASILMVAFHAFRLKCMVNLQPSSQENTMQLQKSIPSKSLHGVASSVSQLILGCDNKNTYEEGAALWDHWLGVGGNAFDTAWIYGGGKHEAALGEWITKRDVASQITVIVKGAHSPECKPDAIESQLIESLGRLKIEKAPIYIMHRDNPDVPVGEFVDVLNGLQAKGLIGIFGGSNWTIARLKLARLIAEKSGQNSFSILNNNLSLATMEKPVWPGCISSRDAGTLRYLATTKLAHISWSSQARGYFLPAALRDRLPEDTRPETCFGSKANAARRARAEELALKYGVTANNIALSWVLAQPFPSLALVGSRTVEEIDTTLPACRVRLTPSEVKWLDVGGT